jgi:hypothetical protein
MSNTPRGAAMSAANLRRPAMAEDEDELQDRYEVANGNFKKREYLTHEEVVEICARLEREAQADFEHAERLKAFGAAKAAEAQPSSIVEQEPTVEDILSSVERIMREDRQKSRRN